MHTTKINQTLFHHNGDYSGEIIIERFDNNIETSITIPTEDIIKFVGEMIRSEMISKLEQIDAKELVLRREMI